jgi:hypothetical protein
MLKFVYIEVERVGT